MCPIIKNYGYEGARRTQARVFDGEKLLFTKAVMDGKKAKDVVYEQFSTKQIK